MISVERLKQKHRHISEGRSRRMDEKTMVADALVGINGELKMFGDMIAQTENIRA